MSYRISAERHTNRHAERHAQRRAVLKGEQKAGGGETRYTFRVEEEGNQTPEWGIAGWGVASNPSSSPTQNVTSTSGGGGRETRVPEAEAHKRCLRRRCDAWRGGVPSAVGRGRRIMYDWNVTVSCGRFFLYSECRRDSSSPAGTLTIPRSSPKIRSCTGPVGRRRRTTA